MDFVDLNPVWDQIVYVPGTYQNFIRPWLVD